MAAAPSTPRRAALSSCPRRRPHRFWATGRPARLLLMAVPAGIDDYFHEINTASTDDEGRQMGERYGMRVVAQ